MVVEESEVEAMGASAAVVDDTVPVLAGSSLRCNSGTSMGLWSNIILPSTN